VYGWKTLVTDRLEVKITLILNHEEPEDIRRQRCLAHFEQSLCSGGYPCRLMLVESGNECFVKVIYETGYHKIVCVTGDSVAAMMQDILRQAFLT